MIDTSDVKSIRCTVAYHDTPFDVRTGEPSVEMQRRHAEWGKRVVKLVDKI